MWGSSGGVAKVVYLPKTVLQQGAGLPFPVFNL